VFESSCSPLHYQQLLYHCCLCDTQSLNGTGLNCFDHLCLNCIPSVWYQEKSMERTSTSETHPFEKHVENIPAKKGTRATIQEHSPAKKRTPCHDTSKHYGSMCLPRPFEPFPAFTFPRLCKPFLPILTFSFIISEKDRQIWKSNQSTDSDSIDYQQRGTFGNR